MTENSTARNSYKIMIVAGEPSGDLHAAKLVTSLSAMPDIAFDFFGSAGPRMRDAGVEAIVAADDLSVVGLPEIARALPNFLRVFNRLKRAATDRRPDVVVLVDFPDFNLKLAKSLSKRGFKIVYYISPQLWAWRRYRIRAVRRYVDLLISILPFEKSWYAKQGVEHVEYVGSPLSREVHATTDRVEFCQSHQLDFDKRIVALLPGSRHKEIVRILPAMLETAALMTRSEPSLQFVIATGTEENGRDADVIIKAAREKGMTLPQTLITIRNETFNALNASDAAAVASGTATLETGILGTPMAIVYKTSGLNYRLLRPLIDVEHFGLINLIAGERVAAELIQDAFTAQSLADELFRLLDAATNREVRERLGVAAEKLGRGGASKRAAEAILRVIENT
ncbi:MAG TPA: lipid-A-disaccharide synthase [Pyrinomonadaceae bacterium]|nr:lipid-A-disaccharide synthase [Pyrinomonadaceae bacterium]